MTLTEKIRMLCDEKGETLASLERKMDFGNGTIRRWDTTVPSGDKLSKIADYFHVSVDYLLGKTSFRNVYELIDSWGYIDPYFDANFDFGGIVKDAREEQGISRDDMAKSIGITTQDLADCEEGILPINRSLADKMASYLDTNISQLLFNNNLYPGDVPEGYHNRVLEWEEMCKKQNNEAMREYIYPPFISQDPSTKHRLEILARHLYMIPEESRERLLKNFEDSVDLYLDTAGIPKEDK